MNRRRFLATCSGGVLAVLAGCTDADEEFPNTTEQTSTPTSTDNQTPTTGTETETPLGGSDGVETPTPTGPPPEITSWVEDAQGYDGGVVDMTDQDSVTITVGAQGEGGAIAFDPALVKIARGSVVQFEWTGNGGQHSVTGDNTDWASGLHSEQGVNFTIAAPSPPYARYYCRTHRSEGMKGAILIE